MLPEHLEITVRAPGTDAEHERNGGLPESTIGAGACPIMQQHHGAGHAAGVTGTGFRSPKRTRKDGILIDDKKAAK